MTTDDVVRRMSDETLAYAMRQAEAEVDRLRARTTECNDWLSRLYVEESRRDGANQQGVGSDAKPSL